MNNVVNTISEIDYENHFKFNNDVVFGSVKYGGCRCLDKDYLTYSKKKAINDGFYILGISSLDSCGYHPTISVNNGMGWGDAIYVLGQCKNGVMHELITDQVIKFVDDVDVIHFCAPRNLMRYSNNIWVFNPLIDGKEFEPRYYYSDLCYVTCNEISKLDALKYLEYFMFSSDNLYDNYCDKLKEMQVSLKEEYNKIINAYYNDISKIETDFSNKIKTKKR